jgi:hypothetical protein
LRQPTFAKEARNGRPDSTEVKQRRARLDGTRPGHRPSPTHVGPLLCSTVSAASRRDACASSTTPVIDRTRAVGLAIETRLFGFLIRLPGALS